MRKTRATMILIKHRFLTLQELRMGTTGLVYTQGLQPGFLPSQIQIDLPLYCHYHFISHHLDLSARVLVIFLVEASKTPSLVPLDNLYPASFSLFVIRKMTLPQSLAMCIDGHKGCTGACSAKSIL